jgi:hypothetical protein
MYTR